MKILSHITKVRFERDGKTCYGNVYCEKSHKLANAQRISEDDKIWVFEEMPGDPDHSHTTYMPIEHNEIVIINAKKHKVMSMCGYRVVFKQVKTD